MPRYEKANCHTQVPPYPKESAPRKSSLGLPDGSDGKEFACHAGHWAQSLGGEDPLGEGNGNLS